MRCYLVKRDGRGYLNRLKSIWDARNPSKTSLSVNVLACHARNIQTAEMLTPYELKALQESISPNVSVDDVQFPSEVLPAQGPDCLLIFPSVDDELSQLLVSEYNVVAPQTPPSWPRLPWLTNTKLFQDSCQAVNQCLAVLLLNQTPSLMHCVQLLHAAARTSVNSVPQRPACSSGRRVPWKQRLQNTILNRVRLLTPTNRWH